MRNALIIGAIVIGAAAIWIFGGRQIVLLLDALATADHIPLVSAPAVVASPGWLNVGNIPLEVSGADGERPEIRVDEAGTRVTVHANDKTFTLGTVRRRDEPYDVVIDPDPGDTVTLAVTHSIIAWPTPLELNFMTGRSPSWKRNVYYTLGWRKRNGAELEMVWRYEQWFYDDWASATMTSHEATGLISTGIRP
jgi:hypothetical protein